MKKKLINLKKTIAEMFKKRFFQLSSGLSLLLILLAVGFVYLQLFPGLQEKIAIPLHYNVHFGIDMYGPWWQIFMFPTMGLIIYLLNLIFAVAMWNREKVLSYFFLTVSVIASLVTFVSTILVVMLNSSYD